MTQGKGQLYLKEPEQSFIGIAVVRMLEDLKGASTNPKYNWTPEARKIQKEMIEAGTTLRIKLEKLGFNVKDFPPVFDGDELEFLTKES